VNQLFAKIDTMFGPHNRWSWLSVSKLRHLQLKKKE
jgi:hypothetical protein